MPVTIRHLLNHTSGLPDYATVPGYFEDLGSDPGTPWSDDAFLARTLAQGPMFAPGQGWGYSNIGYLLVRLVIERTTGHSLRQALNALVLRRAGLTRTFVAETMEDAHDLTPAWSSDATVSSGMSASGTTQAGYRTASSSRLRSTPLRCSTPYSAGR